MTSLVYRNISTYRLAMNLLYRRGYRARLERVAGRVPNSARSVVELCFADTIIAEACRARRIRWTGFDLNPVFCDRARRLGFDAREGDIFSTDFPAADVYLMAGSLYHFHDRLPLLLERMLERTKHVVLSEPIRNLSSEPGWLGWVARRAANPGNGPAAFRYTRATLAAALDRATAALGARWSPVAEDRDLLLEITAAR